MDGSQWRLWGRESGVGPVSSGHAVSFSHFTSQIYIPHSIDRRNGEARTYTNCIYIPGKKHQDRKSVFPISMFIPCIVSVLDSCYHPRTCSVSTGVHCEWLKRMDWYFWSGMWRLARQVIRGMKHGFGAWMCDQPSWNINIWRFQGVSRRLGACIGLCKWP